MHPNLRTTTSTGSKIAVRALFRQAADVFRLPERVSVSDAAAKYRKLENKGAYIGPWLNSMAPYMVEPMDTFASRSFSAMVLVGPAQCGKTDALLLNTALYSIKIDPMDMILYCPTQAAARDFSTRRVDRMHKHSPEIGMHLIKHRDADNKFDKHYDTGMMLNLSWPTPTELAGRPIPRVVLTDRDRMDDDIDGDGEPFDLAMKRTTTFGSYAMCVAESSPSRPLKDPKWIRTSPHEAPPCEGILGLYNRGDRRRLYWPCPECGSYFEGNFRMLTWDKKATDVLAAAETVRMICPRCAEKIHPDRRYDMLQRSVWLKDGQSIDPDGTIHGTGPRTAIASFWINGVAAAFTTWAKLVELYITAMEHYDRTADEGPLQKFYNNDLGEPYLPKSLESQRLPEHLMARAEPLGGSAEDPVVPDNTRFLIGTVDVQQNAFVCQVHGIAPGSPFDIAVVDRFTIHKSLRVDGDGDALWVKPGTYLEDWDLLVDAMISRSYPLADGSGRRMQMKLTLCDSGGKAGVTSNAYEFYREMRRRGLAGRFQLVKGDPTPSAPRTRITYPDSSRRDVKAAAQGDVPVMLMSPNQLKDALSNRLDSLVPGKGMIRFPDWLPKWFYAELCSEVRTEKGWQKISGVRNEAWDLLYYCIGAGVSPLIGAESINWGNPPLWAAEWDKNLLVYSPESGDRFDSEKAGNYDFAALARTLA